MGVVGASDFISYSSKPSTKVCARPVQCKNFIEAFLWIIFFQSPILVRHRCIGPHGKLCLNAAVIELCTIIIILFSGSFFLFLSLHYIIIVRSDFLKYNCVHIAIAPRCRSLLSCVYSGRAQHPPMLLAGTAHRIHSGSQHLD